MSQPDLLRAGENELFATIAKSPRIQLGNDLFGDGIYRGRTYRGTNNVGVLDTRVNYKRKGWIK